MSLVERPKTMNPRKNLEAKEAGNDIELFFVRHGQAEHNVKRVINENNDKPVHLTELGRWQVAEQAKNFKRQVGKLDAVYSSPILRALETTEIILEKYDDPKLKINIDDRLTEIQTGYDGYPNLVWFTRLVCSRNKAEARFRRGKSIQEQAQSINSFLEDIKARHPGETILVVAHIFTFQMINYNLYRGFPLGNFLKSPKINTAGLHKFIISNR